MLKSTFGDAENVDSQGLGDAIMNTSKMRETHAKMRRTNDGANSGRGNGRKKLMRYIYYTFIRSPRAFRRSHSTRRDDVDD